MRTSSTRLAIVILSAAVLGCSGSPAEPLHSDLDLARSVWLESSVRSYSFEVAIRTSWTPKSGYFRVTVADGKVLAATDSSGKAVPTWTLTVDSLWAEIIEARDKGELNSALFNREGVPIETDTGPWPVDGGVHYSMRHFAKTR